MSIELNSIALWSGVLAVLSSVAMGLASVIRAYSMVRRAHRLELTFRDRSFVIDASAIDREDIVNIVRAREAVQEATRIAA